MDNQDKLPYKNCNLAPLYKPHPPLKFSSLQSPLKPSKIPFSHFHFIFLLKSNPKVYSDIFIILIAHDDKFVSYIYHQDDNNDNDDDDEMK